MTKSKIFLIFCIAFIVGVFLGRFINLEIMGFAAMIFIILVAIFWTNQSILIYAVAGLITLTGSWYFQISVSQNDLAPFYGQKISGEGIIIEEPDERSDKTLLTIGKVSIAGLDVKSKILLYVGRFPAHEYGEKIRFQGKVVEPNDAENPGEFSYKNYLSRFGIDGLVYFPNTDVEAEHQGWSVKYHLLKFKKLFISNLSNLLPEPQNAFLAGLLVGLRRSIPQDLIDALAITGTTHIIAISGFNITIIANSINGLLLRFLKRKISFVIALTAIAMFVIMSGAQSSAVRAGIMGGLAMLAQRIGRVNIITNALALTAVLMLAFNPQILHFDAGFQLSFLALIGLVYLSPIISQYFKQVPGYINVYLVPTIAAYIVTLPLLLHTFDRLSVVAIVVNVLVLPMIPVAMLFGFMTGLVALVSQYLALPLAWMTWASLTYVLKVVIWAAKIPFASMNWHLGTAATVVVYIAFVVFMVRMNFPMQFSKLYLWKKPQKVS